MQIKLKAVTICLLLINSVNNKIKLQQLQVRKNRNINE